MDARRRGIYRVPPLRVEATFSALAEKIDWGLSLYGVPALWKRSRGEGIKIAVLDTGIDENHHDLREAVESARDFTGSRHGPSDGNGHGTHVAGIIAARRNERGVVGVAPACRLIVAKVLTDRRTGKDGQVAQGIAWCVESGADILSLSLGSPEPSEALAEALREAVARGRFVVCAAGNDGRHNSVNYPARYPFTVAVGAVDRNGVVARFSSRGPQVDLCAPGQNVLSTYRNGGYARLSGTSIAAPFVTGVVALLLAKHRHDGGQTPVRNQEQLLEYLRRTARDAGPAGHDPAYGWGSSTRKACCAEARPLASRSAGWGRRFAK